MKELLVYYCRYNIWANEKLALFFQEKEENVLSQFIENSFPSIRKTAMHILSAEKSWLARMSQDKANNKRIDDNFDITFDVFNDLVMVSNKFLQFVENQDDMFFSYPLSYNTWDGTNWEMKPQVMVHHCMNHSTYHRGQLITLARQLGMKEGIPSTDLLYYSRTV